MKRKPTVTMEDVTMEEVNRTLKHLERLGVVESFVDADGEVRYRAVRMDLSGEQIEQMWVAAEQRGEFDHLEQ